MGLTEKSISLEGYREQDIPLICPECGYKFAWDEILGRGKYPVGGFRQMMKPNREGYGFECPKCFEKSCCHVG